jgi:Cof subfamily protein (haloacid dehalogenase superfamily)
VYRAVYFDLDGTLLAPDGAPRPATLRVLEKLRARDVVIGIATGRRAMTSRAIARDAGVNAPAILCNGARILDASFTRTLFARDLPLDVARDAVDLAIAHRVHTCAYVEDALLVDVRVPRKYGDALLAGYPRETVDLSAAMTTQPTKLLFVDEPDALEMLSLALRAMWGHDGPSLVRSHPHFLEVLPRGVSKGAALPTALQPLGIALSEVIAFGDEHNDVEMLAAAGLGIAMDNAPPDVKAVAARSIGGHDTDAIAEVLTSIFGL